MPDRFSGFQSQPFPYEDKLQELMGQQPQWQPRGQEALTQQAQQHAGIYVDPQVQALQRWEPQQAQQDLESAISRGGGRGGAVDWLAAQRQERFGTELQRLEGTRGDIAMQELQRLTGMEHERGQQGHQQAMAALQQLAQMASAHDAEQWSRALGVHDRTMLTPMQQHQLNLGYGDLIGEIPGFMVDPYGARQGAPAGQAAAPQAAAQAPAAAALAPTGISPSAPSAPAAQPPPMSGTTNYTIQKGDSLSRIAQRYGITTDDLRRLNPQITNPNLIYSGQRINVPGAAAQTTYKAPPTVPTGGGSVTNWAQIM